VDRRQRAGDRGSWTWRMNQKQNETQSERKTCAMAQDIKKTARHCGFWNSTYEKDGEKQAIKPKTGRR
jgi:hypothetical protein